MSIDSHCARCLRPKPELEGWEDTASETDGETLWVCPDCLTDEETAAIEEQSRELMALSSELRQKPQVDLLLAMDGRMLVVAPNTANETVKISITDSVTDSEAAPSGTDIELTLERAETFAAELASVVRALRVLRDFGPRG